MNWDFRRQGARICVCYDVSNDQALAAWRAAENPSVDQLSRQFHCGRHCAMCIPYFETLLSEYKAGCWPAKA